MGKLTLSGRLHQVSLGCDDLSTSRTFYENVLRLKFIAQYDPPGLLFFDLDGTRLLIEKGAGASVLYFRVDDIDASCRALEENGVVLEQQPHMIFADSEGVFGPAGEEEWMAFFRDPAGNMLALATRRPG